MSVPSIQGSHVRIVDGAAQVRLVAVHHLDLNKRTFSLNTKRTKFNFVLVSSNQSYSLFLD